MKTIRILQLLFPVLSLCLMAGCGRPRVQKQLTPTETVQSFYEILRQMPTAEQVRSDPVRKVERRRMLLKASDLVAVDNLRIQAGRNPLARKVVDISVAVTIGAQVLMARPDVQRLYHGERITVDKAVVLYTLIAGPAATRTEHEVTLVRERGAWRILVFR